MNAEARSRLDSAIQTVFDDGDFLTFLRFRRRIHHYSLNNTFLIFSQRRDATVVMGYRKWQEFGRQVQKGEKAISIFFPVLHKTETDQGTTEKAMSFFIKPAVFDVLQTAGDPLPDYEMPILEHEGHDQTLALMTRVAEGFGFPVHHEDTGDAKGWFQPSTGKIALHTTEGRGVQGIKTLAHEISHGLTPELTSLDPRAAEAIAEASAFLVVDFLGMDTTLYSSKYIAGWAEDIALFRAGLPIADHVSALIIDAIQKEFHHVPRAVA